MDDDKEKTIIEKFSDVVKGVLDTASTAATKVMEPDPDPEKVAGTANEQVYMPVASDAAAPAPLISTPKASKKIAALSMSGRITPTYDFPVPDFPIPSLKKKRKAAVKKEKAIKKTARKKSKAAKKTMRKSSKKSAKTTVGKTSAKKAKKKKAKRGWH
jgi:hypothetical protein